MTKGHRVNPHPDFTMQDKLKMLALERLKIKEEKQDGRTRNEYD